MATRSLMTAKGRIAPSLKERQSPSRDAGAGAFAKSGPLGASLAIQKLKRNVRTNNQKNIEPPGTFTKSGLLAASLAIQKMRRNARTTNPISEPQTLNPDKFQDLMSTDLTSGFEENSECFEGICRKSAAIVDSRRCCIYVFHEQEHHLVTYMKDTVGEDIQIIKPVDRGITGFVLMEEKGINIADVKKSKYWSEDIDNSEGWGTQSYLGWPLRDTMDGSCVGILEFYDKIDDGSTGIFNMADEQMAQILAFQVSRAIVHYRQQSLLEVRDKAINIVYQKSAGENDSIVIDDDSVATTARSSSVYSERVESMRSKFVLAKQRSAIIVSSSKWKWTGSTKSSLLCERDWAYDVFSKSEDELIQHAVEIFEERGLFSCFSIPVSIFMNFCREIIAGYEKAPYHNYYHAFDVMHVCYLFIAKCGADEYLDSFNVLSILVGALAHDLGHDGFNNAFHCSTNSELAVVYNGISVLENYSAAYLFRILRKKNCNIFARLSEEEMNKMRSRLIDIILDTDAKNHFILVTRFKHSVDMKQLSRGLLSSMLLHVSDVSNPTRPGVISRKWAFAVQEEFFRQGDKEKECNLPISPFMDRSFENLPRMQGAFIDALVGPIFNQFAELFPSVKFQCGRHLQINRSFWKSMQNKSIITSEGIIAYLKTRENGDFDEEDDETERRVSTISAGSHDTPIPGIPAEARTESMRMDKEKRLSMAVIHPTSTDSIISLSDNEDIESGIQLPSVDDSFHKKNQRQSFQMAFSAKKDSLTLVLNSPITQSIMMVATIFSLVASDLKLAVGHKDTDIYVDVVILVVFIMFVVELIISIICDPKYKKFFLWLDLAAIISLLLEMDFVLQLTSSTSDDLAIAKAGRAAKVGARAGRLAKIFRIVRLIKVLKVLKWFMRGKGASSEQNEVVDNEDSDKDIDMKMSIVGSKMTESITKKVILSVLFMLLAFSLLDTNFIPDGRELQLDALARNPDSQLLREILFQAHDNLIRLVGAGPTFEMSNRIEELRDVEIMTIASKSDQSVLASFDLSAEVSTAALLSLATTFVVTALLGILSLLFTSDAYKIMIRPIEKMKSAVQRLSQNPLQHLEDVKRFQGHNKSKSDSEIDLLEKAIKKMASLLQVGFGPDGAEIISKSIGHMGELVPMTAGTKVHSIFCFCRIHDYTCATDYLQEDITLFINSLAKVTHERAIESGGAPNKNNGEAFFLVWKLNSKKGARLQLQKELFDRALCTVQNIAEDIKKMGSMFDFMTKEGILDGKIGAEENWRSFMIRMTFGLHVGWAIEGSIGSKVKVDASYISPHVCLTTQIEKATDVYNVPVLITGDLMSSLSGKLQATCRPVDKLIFDGYDEPMMLYHQDIVPFFNLREKPLDYDNLLLSTIWRSEIDLVNSGVDLREITKILENNDCLVLREVYDRAFYAYLDGEWDKSKILFHLWLKKFPGDILAQSLTKHLISCNFECPSKWEGHRKL